MNIKELVRCLKPVLKDKKKAEELLTRYGEDKFFITWTVQEVFRAANERGVARTKAEAVQVLKELEHAYNSQYGTCWSDLTKYIEDRMLGRPLNKREIKRFVEKDIIIIQR